MINKIFQKNNLYLVKKKISIIIYYTFNFFLIKKSAFKAVRIFFLIILENVINVMLHVQNVMVLQQILVLNVPQN
jgi:hypothetical protein